MDKTTFGLVGIVALIAGVAFFGERAAKPPERKDRVIVRYWAGWTNFEADAMRDVVNKFNKSQDRIEVQFLSVSGIQQKTLLATASGIPPDIASLGSYDIPMYAFQGALEPLDEMAAEAGIKREDYIPYYYDLLKYQGKLWAMPTTPATTALHINRALLSGAGLDPNKPPQTIEELDAMDQAILVKDKSDRIVRNGFLPSEPGWWNWSWGYFFGGQLWDGESKLTPDSPENIRAFTWMTGYTKRYGLSTVQQFQGGFGGFDSPQNAFLADKVASVMQGVWMGNFIRRHRGEKNPMDWYPVPFPHPADRPDLANTTCAELDIVVIPRGAKHKKEAFEFMAFLQKQENMEMLCLGHAKHTPLAKVSDEFYAKHTNPYIRQFRDYAFSPNAFSVPKTPVWAEYSAELNVAIQKINLLQETPEVALRKVRLKMQPRLDAYLAAEKVRFRN